MDTLARRHRLMHRHGLVTPVGSVVEAARAVVGLHSSDPATVLLSAAIRTRLPLAEVEAQLYDDELGLRRIHGMRRTLWMLAPEHVENVMLAVAPDVADKERRRLIGWIEAAGFTDDAEAWLADIGDRTVAAIADQPGLGTRELSDVVPDLDQTLIVGSGKWTTETPAKSRILFVLAMEGRIHRGPPSGSWVSSQYEWLAADERVSGDPHEAAVSLVGDWLHAYGPATLADIAWWFGWGIRASRAALADLDTTDVGEDLIMLTADVGAPTPGDASPVARLLPSLDPSVMGWKERDWILGPHTDALFDRNGNAGPIVLVNGRAVGAWGQSPAGEVIVELMEHLDDGEAEAVEAERRWIEEWLDGTVVRPRFPSPASTAIMKSADR